VIQRFPSSIRTKALLGSLSLLTFACALAQTPQTDAASSTAPRAQPVPLVSGACPAVGQGGAISLDWNPAFDSSWAVTGIKSFRLIFQSLLADGVTPNPASRLVMDSGPRGRATAIGDGSFHIEARLPSSTHPGIYHLVMAHTSPELLPNYQGDSPKATVSPASEDFCITVAPAPQASTSSAPE
jgi:hypothetical protein